jgi:hypothetical protein
MRSLADFICAGSANEQNRTAQNLHPDPKPLGLMVHAQRPPESPRHERHHQRRHQPPRHSPPSRILHTPARRLQQWIEHVRPRKLQSTFSTHAINWTGVFPCRDGASLVIAASRAASGLILKRSSDHAHILPAARRAVPESVTAESLAPSDSPFRMHREIGHDRLKRFTTENTEITEQENLIFLLSPCSPCSPWSYPVG